MKVWLKHKQTSARDWDYDLIDLDPNGPDSLFGDEEPITDTEKDFDRFCLAWLNNDGACRDGEYWYGAEFDWTLVDRPPVEWFDKEERFAEINYVRSLDRLVSTQNAVLDYYPDNMHQLHEFWIKLRAGLPGLVGLLTDA